MDNNSKKTTNKQRGRPLTGSEGNTFTKDNQPTSEAKKQGWQKLRQQRLLTQSIIKEMLGTDGVPTESFKGYLRALIQNAKQGNAKAIEAVNKCLEDDILKIAQTDTEGNDIPRTTITTSDGKIITL